MPKGYAVLYVASSEGLKEKQSVKLDARNMFRNLFIPLQKKKQRSPLK